jgi:hypothetical protein
MYKLIKLFLLLFFIAIDCTGQWTKVPGPELGNTKYNRYFVPDTSICNKSYLYCVTKTSIYNSSNSGKTWNKLYTDTKQQSQKQVHYGNASIFLASEDSIYYFNSIDGYARGNNQVSFDLLFSPDRGKSWTTYRTPGFLDLNALENGTLIGITNKGEVYKSTSNGKYWQTVNIVDSMFECYSSEKVKNQSTTYKYLIVKKNKCLIYFTDYYSESRFHAYFYSDNNAESFSRVTFPATYSTCQYASEYTGEGKLRDYYQPVGISDELNGFTYWMQHVNNHRDQTEWKHPDYQDFEIYSCFNVNESSNNLKLINKDSIKAIPVSVYRREYEIFYKMATTIQESGKYYYIQHVNGQHRYGILNQSEYELYRYSPIDQNRDYVYGDITENLFDKSFLRDSPKIFENAYYEGGGDTKFYVPYHSYVKDLLPIIDAKNENPASGYLKNFQTNMDKIDKLKKSPTGTIYSFKHDNLYFSVQKVEIVGDSKMKVKLINAPMRDDIPSKFQGVKMIQSAEIIVNLIDLALSN